VLARRPDSVDDDVLGRYHGPAEHATTEDIIALESDTDLRSDESKARRIRATVDGLTRDSEVECTKTV